MPDSQEYYGRKTGMPIASPTAQKSGEAFPHLQILSGCLLLALSLCIPVVIYTDHVKRAAAMIAPILNSSAAETFVPAKIAEAGALEGDTPRVQLQDADFLLATSQHQSAGVDPNSGSAPERRSGDERASRKPEMSRRNMRKPTPGVQLRSVAPTPARTWSRNNSPRRVKAALISLWKRVSKTSLKHHN